MIETKKIFFTIGLAIFGLTACEKDEVEPVEEEVNSNATVLDCNYFDQDRVLTDDPDKAVDYRITCKMAVAGDIKIEPGVVIEFEQNAGINVDDFNVPKASLSAVGTEDKPIVFRGVTNDPGHWGGIRYNSNSSLNELTYVYIEDAGGTSMGGNGEKAGVIVYAESKLKMTNSKVTNSENYGLNAQYNNTDLTLSDNIFTNNNNPAYVSTVCVEDLNESNSFTGNTEDFVRVRNRPIDTDKTWKKIDVKYQVDGDIDVYAFLTIEPGVKIEMAQESEIDIKDDGAFKAVGNAGDPIVFSGIDKAPKAWQGIRLNSKNALNEIAFAEIEYSGINGPAHNVYLWFEAVLNIHDVKFTNVAGCGINYKLFNGQAENPNLTIGSDITVDPSGCIHGEWD